jgi:Fe-S-cluster containining protein
MATPNDFLTDGKWGCIMCGACCLHVNLYPDLLPGFDRGDGGCKNLAADMTCSIYEDRPEICRQFTPGNNANASACAELKSMMDREISRGVRQAGGKRLRTPGWKNSKEK